MSSGEVLLPVAVVALVTSAVASAAAKYVLERRGVLDLPNHRSLHERPIVRGGGIGVLTGVVTGLLTPSASWTSDLAVLMAASVLLGIIGFLDDLLGSLSALFRFAMQLGIGFVLAMVLLDPGRLNLLLAIPLILIATGWVAGYVNAFNFMDGINGLSCAQSVVAGLTFAAIGQRRHVELLAVGGVALATAALGFLPFNFPRARMFLGDVGSYGIGCFIAGLGLAAIRFNVPLEAAFAPTTIYVVDVGSTLVRRYRRGATLHEAHKEHIFQLLVTGGWSHQKTTATLSLWMAGTSLLGLLTLDGSGVQRVIADVLILGLALGYLALPRLLRLSHPSISS